MWNPFRMRSTEYRKLSARLVELEDDVTKLTELFERISARQRGRLRRNSADSESDSETPPPAAAVEGPDVVVAQDRMSKLLRIRAARAAGKI